MRHPDDGMPQNPISACVILPYKTRESSLSFLHKGLRKPFTTVVTHREACCVGVNGIEAFKIDGGLYGQVRA